MNEPAPRERRHVLEPKEETMRPFVTVLAFAIIAVPLSAAEPTLAEKLKPIIDAHKGKVAIAV